MPPSPKLLELDLSTTVAIDSGKRRPHLGVAETDAQLIEQLGHLGFVDLAVAVTIEAFKAVSHRVRGHGSTLRRPVLRSNRLLCTLVWALFSCQNAPRRGDVQPAPAPRAEAHPVLPSEPSRSLPALAGDWQVLLRAGDRAIVVMPPVGAVAPARLLVGAHGAGDRPDWACGGWRLAAQASAFVACPEGHPLRATTFAWVSPQELEQRVLETVSALRARYANYLADSPLIFAGFSQGATYAEPLLRQHAALLPIAILAEGGYRTAQSPSFANAYHAGGGRRVVLVCGTASCFVSARTARPVLEHAGLDVVISGDPRAGHNLNGRMQTALQASWAAITAPLVTPPETPPVEPPATSKAPR